MTPGPQRTDERRHADRVTRSDRSRTNPSDPERPARPEDVLARVDRLESELGRLENTVRGVARVANVDVGCPCNRCDRSYLLISDDVMACPVCGYRRPL